MTIKQATLRTRRARAARANARAAASQVVAAALAAAAHNSGTDDAWAKAEAANETAARLALRAEEAEAEAK